MPTSKNQDLTKAYITKLTTLALALFAWSCGSSVTDEDEGCHYDQNYAGDIFGYWEPCTFIHDKDVCVFYPLYTSDSFPPYHGYVCSYDLKSRKIVPESGLCSEFIYRQADGNLKIKGVGEFRFFINDNNARVSAWPGYNTDKRWELEARHCHM